MILKFQQYAAESSAASQQIVAYHTVESGESLWQIAQQHRVGLRELKGANALPPETAIRIGQVLKVPGSETQAADASSELVARITADDATAPEAASRRSANNKLSRLQNTVTSTAKDSVLIAQTREVESIRPESLAANFEDADSSEASSAEPNTEIANAPSQASAAPPVVTALAASAPSTHYQVQAGDTLNTIASSLGTTSAELIRANALANPNVILVGDRLRVPTSATRIPAPAASKSAAPILVADSAQPTDSNRRLAYLRSTAVLPDSTMLQGRIAADEPVSASVDAAEAVSSETMTGANVRNAESIDPYVENLLEEVQEIRTQSVQISETDASQGSAIEADSALLARTETPTIRPTLAERVRRTSVPAATAPAESGNSNLLAAAPISPDAYIPAQRSAAPQVVSPDMPILPGADEFLPEAPDYFDGFIWPTQGTVTSGYGWRWGRMHRGVDVAGPVGTPIVAAGTGVVEQAGWNSGGYGNLVEIRHPDGSLTRYAHNNRLDVSAGQAVKKGQKIAEMGSTGYSTGPHLHFEVHQGGGAVNPVAYLPSR